MRQHTDKILCIEDDEDACQLVTFVFQQEGYEVESCSEKDCLKLIHEEKFLAVILDNYFVDMSGINICKELRSFDSVTPVVFFSGEARQVEIDKAISAGADTYLVKPNDFEKLVPVTINLIKNSQLTA